MTNSAHRPLSLAFASIAMTLLLSTAAAQDGFYKVFPSNEYQSVSDLLAISDNSYAFVTTSFFYTVDGSGDVKLKKELRQGTYSQLESVIRDDESNFWISSTVFDNTTTSRKVLYKVTNSGQLLTTVSVNDPTPFEFVRLVPAGNSGFFMSYKARSATGNAAIRVALMDKNGNKIWEKQSTDTVLNNYRFKSGPNNTADIFFQHIGTRQGEIVNIDGAGNLTRQAVHLDQPANEHYYTSDFVRLPDGFAFAGVVQQSAPLNTDGLVYRTDTHGNPVWIKKMNIRSGDNFFSIATQQDGFIVIGSAGVTNVANDTDGDIVLIRLNESGNEIWTRAFGGAKMDYARHLQVLHQHIIFAGQSSFAGQQVGVPAICRTDINGRLPSSLPFQAEDENKLTLLETPVQHHPSSLVQSAAGNNGTIISGGNETSPDDDQIYPFVVSNEQSGRTVWYHRLSDHPGTLRLLKQIRTDQYIAVTEMKDLFQNRYDIFLLNESGKIIWKQQVSAGAIKDVIATRDGGMLFTGTMDISFINYETLLIKLDGYGNMLWQKTVGDLRLWETGRKIIETPDQDFLIVGNVQREFDITSSLYLLKIDRDGNKRWSRTFADGITTDAGYDVIITTDNGLLFAGTSNKQPFTDKNILLLKTDNNGVLQWKRSLDIHLMDEGFQLMAGNANSFLLTGTTAEPAGGALEKFVFVMRFDEAGNRKGARYFGKKGLQTMHPCLTVLTTGDTLISGTTQQRYGKEQLFMVKLNGFIATEDPTETFIKLYPNPSRGVSTLFINQPATGPVSIIIYNATGQEVKRFQGMKENDIYRQELTATGMATGLYYVQVWIGERSTTVKWLVRIE